MEKDRKQYLGRFVRKCCLEFADPCFSCSSRLNPSSMLFDLPCLLRRLQSHHSSCHPNRDQSPSQTRRHEVSSRSPSRPELRSCLNFASAVRGVPVPRLQSLFERGQQREKGKKDGCPRTQSCPGLMSRTRNAELTFGNEIDDWRNGVADLHIT